MATLPTAAALTGANITKEQQRVALEQLRQMLNDVLGTTGTPAGSRAVLLGRFESDWVTPLPGAGAKPSFTHGLAGVPVRAWVIAECLTADGGYAPGERVALLTNDSNTYNMPVPVAMTSTSVTALISSNVSLLSRSSASGFLPTPASWQFKVCAEL